MSSFDDCVNALMELGKAGKISGVSITKVARLLNKQVDEELPSLRRNFKGYSEAEIQQMASDIALNKVSKDLKRIQIEEFYNTTTRLEMVKSMKEDVSGSYTRALANRLQLADKGTEATFAMMINGPMGEFAEKFKGLPFGVDKLIRNNKPILDDIVRSLHGETVADEIASGFAASYKKVIDGYRSAFAKYGIDFPEIKNYDYAHIYSYKKVTDMGKGEWVKRTQDRVDWSKTKSFAGRAMNPDEQAAYLGKIYDDMERLMLGTDGVQSYTKSAGQRLGERMNRKLIYKNADAWLSQQKDFGQGNIYTNLIQEVHNLSRELSMLTYFGPDAAANFNYANSIAKENMIDRKLAGRGYRALNDPAVSLEKQWKVISGETSQIVSPKTASFFSTVRSTQVASKLGSAIINSLNDQANAWAASQLYGMAFKKYFGNFFKTLSGLEKGEKAKVINRISTSLDMVQSYMSVSNRFDEFPVDTAISKAASQMATGILQVTGLVRWTEAAKKAFVYTHSAELADLAELQWTRLPQHVKQSFGMYGITPKVWDTARTSLLDVADDSGKIVDTVIDPEKMFGKDASSAVKWQAYMGEAARQAIKEPSVETKAIMTQGMKTGEFYKEAMSLPLQFKSFLITHVLDNMRNILFDPRVNNRYSYFGKWAIFSMMAGGLSLYLNSLAKGEPLEFKDVITPTFMASAAMQGGLFGFGSDVYFSLGKFANYEKGAKELSQSWTHNLLGPSGQFIFDGIANAAMLVRHGINPMNNKGAEADAVKFLRKNTPGSNIWYLKAMQNHFIWDRFEEMADPKRYKRKMEFIDKMRNQGK